MDSYQGFCSNKENKYIFNIHTVLNSMYSFQAIIHEYKEIILCQNFFGVLFFILYMLSIFYIPPG
jgi:hypothetical protein